MICEVQGCGAHGTECRVPDPDRDWAAIYHYCRWHALIEGFCPRCGELLVWWYCPACQWPEDQRISA